MFLQAQPLRKTLRICENSQSPLIFTPRIVYDKNTTKKAGIFMIHKKSRFRTFLMTLSLCAALLFDNTISVLASQTTAASADISNADAEPVSWPQGPSVTAEAAILLEANTGTILYAKNIHEQHFPASTTKILTALIAMEEADMDDMVEYSLDAVNSINWREDSNIGIKPGEAITMEQSLYGLMVGSGNECGNAIGEHISGSMEAFVDKMNQYAKDLGCENSHFVTTNGIHDDAHYTSAYDLALIAQRYFSYDLLCKMSSTLDYVIPASDTLSQKLIPYTKNKLLPGRQYAYDGLVGSKTGYTSIAQQNLVSCAERDGMKLICVVMKDSSPYQFTDTVDLFNFGFSNFELVNVAQQDTRYTVKTGGFFDRTQDIFGNSAPLLSVDKDAYLILPKGAKLEDTASSLSYENLKKGQAAMINYTYLGEPVGNAAILLSETVNSFDFSKDITETAAAQETVKESKTKTAESQQDKIVFLNIHKILFWVISAASLLIFVLVVLSFLRSRRLAKKRRAIMKRRRGRNQEIIDFDRYINRDR